MSRLYRSRSKREQHKMKPFSDKNIEEVFKGLLLRSVSSRSRGFRMRPDPLPSPSYKVRHFWSHGEGAPWIGAVVLGLGVLYCRHLNSMRFESSALRNSPEKQINFDHQDVDLNLQREDEISRISILNESLGKCFL